MSKHTPGPWEAEHDGDDRLAVIPKGRDYPICDLGTVNADDYDADVIEALWADARLIAAAPDLLAALRLLAADVQGYEAWQRPCHALDVALAAIEKAEGRS